MRRVISQTYYQFIDIQCGSKHIHNVKRCKWPLSSRVIKESETSRRIPYRHRFSSMQSDNNYGPEYVLIREERPLYELAKSFIGEQRIKKFGGG